MNLIGAGSWKK